MLINLVSCGFFDDESRSFSQLMMPSINLIIVIGYSSGSRFNFISNQEDQTTEVAIEDVL